MSPAELRALVVRALAGDAEAGVDGSFPVAGPERLGQAADRVVAALLEEQRRRGPATTIIIEDDVEVTEWRPMETAPKDGEVILVAFKDSSVDRCWWNGSHWESDGTLWFHDAAIGWLPLPAPPAPEEP